ncbi:MAG: TRAP transporter small permease [Alphaproteobacteria bacterium]|nr:TRAP transporter small permease [Alphaproteobacteria bacterium]
MRRLLDGLYGGCAWAAAVSMVAILLVILVQVFGSAIGVYVRGTDAYAGYAMASASFFALAHTLTRGEHIRVTLFLDKAPPGLRRVLELWCLGAAIALSAAFAYYSWDMVWWSYAYNDVSSAQDETPLWIPQLTMAIGVTVLTVAFLDQLVAVLTGRGMAQDDGSLKAME